MIFSLNCICNHSRARKPNVLVNVKGEQKKVNSFVNN